MTLAELVIKISCDSSEAEKGIESTEKSASKLGDKMSSVSSKAGKVGKFLVSTLATSAVAVGKFTASAVKAYAQYEQLTGGVETLFGTSAKSLKEYQKQIGVTEKSTKEQVEKSIRDYNNLTQAQKTVMDNARQAYKTAGMDMNSYMETVTSFSASLIQSLGGDTVKAAEYAHRAIVDMSDNANKMGTSIESIQNAYQGFAKQNYTMLDNLKLGYGGTKTEMERLIKDAAQLTDVQKELGITVDANSLSFGNIVNAISVMQKQMGIAGTTSAEAASTISGSLGMMQASWENLKITIADPNGNINQALDDFITSAKTFAGNVVPTISQSLKGIGVAIRELAPVIGQELPGLISDVLPDLVSAAVDLVTGLTQAIIDNAPMIIDGFGQIFQAIGNTMIASDNPIIKAAGQLAKLVGDAIRDPVGTLKGFFKQLWTDIKTNTEKQWNAIKQTASTVWNNIKNAITTAISSVVGSLSNIWNDVKAAAQTTWDTIGSLASAIWSNISNTISSSVSSVVGILSGIWDSIKVAATNAWDSLVSVASTIWSNVSTAMSSAVSGVVGVLSGIWNGVQEAARSAWNSVVSIASTVWGNVKSAISGALDGIGATLSNIWNGIKSTAQSAWDAVVSTATSTWNSIKSAITKPIEQAKSTIQTAWTAIKNAAKNAWDSIVETINTALAPIQSAIDGVIGTISDVIGWFGQLLGFDGQNLSSTTSDHTHTTIYKEEGTPPANEESKAGAVNANSKVTALMNAHGNWYVPYDDYLTYLHRGEAVLTASQARKFRDGELKNSGFDIQSLQGAIIAAIRDGMMGAQVNSYLDGRKVTDEVNRIMGSDLSARRYAT